MICYTTITNNWDILKEPYISEGWDYVCFSDKFQNSPVWQTHVTSDHNRDMKIKPQDHLFAGLTLYIDGSIEVIGDLNEFIKEVGSFAIWHHPERNCTYDEAKAVIRLKRSPRVTVHQQMKRYKECGFPEDWGLGANGVMLRDLSDLTIRRICREWMVEYKRSVPRDQLSLMYVCWKNGLKPHLFGRDIFSKYFRKHSHNRFRKR